MKGKPATKADKEYMARVAALGCLICRDFYEYFDVPAAIHHVAGKTRPGAHRLVLPLCGIHHQGGDDGDDSGHVSRHPYKKRFEQKYDTETNLLKRVQELLDDNRD